MSQKTKGEVIGAAILVSREAEKPHQVADWIRAETLPYFRGNFHDVVDTLAGSGSHAGFQGNQDSTWDRIQAIGQRNARLGDALTAMAVEHDVALPPGKFDIA